MADPETFAQVADGLDQCAHDLYARYGFDDPAVCEAVHDLHAGAQALRRVAGIAEPVPS